MEGGQDVKQPDIVRGPNQKEAECDYDARQVRYDEGILAVIAVGYHAGDGADEEWCEHTDDEEAADSKSGLGEYCDKRSGSDKVEPIPQETDNLSKPEQAESYDYHESVHGIQLIRCCWLLLCSRRIS